MEANGGFTYFYQWNKSIIRARSLNPKIGKDSLVWASSKTGQYNAKYGYKVLANYGEQEDQVIPQKIFWNSKIVPKVGIFAWLTFKKKILITKRFTKIGYEGPSISILSKAQVETMDHLLLNCPFASKWWWWLCAKFGWITALPNDIVSLFQCWPLLFKESTLGQILEISPSCLVWEIWKERNRRLFYDKARRFE